MPEASSVTLAKLADRIENNGIRHFTQLTMFANGMIEEEELCEDDRKIVAHIRAGASTDQLRFEIDTVENGGHLDD